MPLACQLVLSKTSKWKFGAERSEHSHARSFVEVHKCVVSLAWHLIIQRALRIVWSYNSKKEGTAVTYILKYYIVLSKS